MNIARNYIEVNPNILGGEPVFRGTKIAIKTLFDYLESSSLDDFPSVTKEQAIGVIEWAQSGFVPKSSLHMPSRWDF